jgi:hypothetical protein
MDADDMMWGGRYIECGDCCVFGAEGGVCGVVCDDDDAEDELFEESGMGCEYVYGDGVVCCGGKAVGGEGVRWLGEMVAWI